MNEVMSVVLSEWNLIKTEVKALVSNGLFVTNWETFMSYDCVKGEKRIFEVRWVWPKGGEFKES